MWLVFDIIEIDIANYADDTTPSALDSKLENIENIENIENTAASRKWG